MKFQEKYKIDKDWLYQKHYIEHLTTEEIGQLIRCDGRTIRYRLRKYGLRAILNDSQYRKGKPNPKNEYPRTQKQLEVLRISNIGRIPWNKGLGNKSFKCLVCGKKVSDKSYRRKKFCSKECKDLYSHLMRGENHWNYKGKNDKLQRTWSQYKEWHRKVLEKDNFTCQVCGKRGGKLEVHHIKSFADYPDLRFEVSNGIAVHKTCHLAILHKWNINPDSWKKVATNTWKGVSIATW